MGRYNANYDIFSAKSTIGTGGKAFSAADFRHSKLTLSSGATALTATIKVYGSTTEKGEDIDFESDASISNLYDGILVVNNENGDEIAGDTGIAYSASANDVRNFAFNIDNLNWLAVKITSIGTAALLTGGTSATAVVGTWTAVSDGEFAITINGVAYDITAIDFSSGVASMANVATKIQTAIRAATSGTETVEWSTDHFVITSDTSGSQSLTVTSAVSGGSGTDISGVAATAFMDAEVSVGTVTAAVIGTITGKILLSDNS